MLKFHVTYDVVTPESAKDGDTAENGYVHANGGRDSLDRVDNVDDYAMDLRTALRHCTPHYDSGRWFSQEGAVEDYATDETISYDLHPPRNITPASYARLRRFLAVR
jgi:hypothetical protein